MAKNGADMLSTAVVLGGVGWISYYGIKHGWLDKLTGKRTGPTPAPGIAIATGETAQSSGSSQVAPTSSAGAASNNTGASGYGTWVVNDGETLSYIAGKVGSTVAALASLNGIANPDLIFTGTALRYQLPRGPMGPMGPVGSDPSGGGSGGSW